MNVYIYLFLLVGACFGLVSYSKRHLFSEGPVRTGTRLSGSVMGDRVFWLLVCTALWPVMLLAGLNSAWVLARRKRR